MDGYYVGNCLDLLRAVPDGSVDCCVTSPPYYGLRSYLKKNNPVKPLEIGHKRTPGEYIAKLVEVFREVRRVLRDDGTLWLNLGDASCSSGGHADIKCNDRRGAYNIGNRPEDDYREFRCKPTGAFKSKDLMLLPARIAIALHEDGWWLRQDVIEEVQLFCPCGCGYQLEEHIWRWSQDRDLVWKKPNPMPSSAKDRPTRSHEYLFILTKSARYFYDYKAIQEPAVRGAAGSSFCKGKTGIHQLGCSSRRPRDSKNTSHAPGTPEHSGLHRAGQEREPGMRNKRSVWQIKTEPLKVAHFATFPRKLVEPCILAGCPEGGVVLDPFAGSGTVALVARALNRSWLCFDLNPAYPRIAERRMLKLFGDTCT
jgi:DNA modification methylase